MGAPNLRNRQPSQRSGRHYHSRFEIKHSAYGTNNTNGEANLQKSIPEHGLMSQIFATQQQRICSAVEGHLRPNG
jgi:hypothetical protein